MLKRLPGANPTGTLNSITKKFSGFLWQVQVGKKLAGRSEYGTEKETRAY